MGTIVEFPGVVESADVNPAPLCVSCNLYRTGWKTADGFAMPACGHALARVPPVGNDRLSCEAMRGPGRLCGPAGKLWEPVPPPPPKRRSWLERLIWSLT